MKLTNFLAASAYAHDIAGFDHDHLHTGAIYNPPTPPVAPMALDPLMLLLLLGDDKPTTLKTRAELELHCATVTGADTAACLHKINVLYREDGTLAVNCSVINDPVRLESCLQTQLDHQKAVLAFGDQKSSLLDNDLLLPLLLLGGGATDMNSLLPLLLLGDGGLGGGSSDTLLMLMLLGGGNMGSMAEGGMNSLLPLLLLSENSSGSGSDSLITLMALSGGLSGGDGMNGMNSLLPLLLLDGGLGGS